MVWEKGARAGVAQANKRVSDRKATHKSAVLHYKGTQIPVVLKDVSHGGTQMELNAMRSKMPLEGPMRLDIPGVMQVPVDIRWRSAAKLGVAFNLPESRKATLAHQLDRLKGGPGLR